MKHRKHFFSQKYNWVFLPLVWNSVSVNGRIAHIGPNFLQIIIVTSGQKQTNNYNNNNNDKTHRKKLTESTGEVRTERNWRGIDT